MRRGFRALLRGPVIVRDRDCRSAAALGAAWMPAVPTYFFFGGIFYRWGDFFELDFLY